MQLATLGDFANGARHCESIAAAPDLAKPNEMRTFLLDGVSGPEGLRRQDTTGAPTITTTALRTGAGAPINFL